MLFMAFSSYPNTYTVQEHFEKNVLTPKVLNQKIIVLKQYCETATEAMQSGVVPDDFVTTVDSQLRDMFYIGLTTSEKEKIRGDFELANPREFTFEIIIR